MPLGLESRGVLVHRPADLVQDVLELGRLRERALPVMTGLMTGAVHGQLVGSHAPYGATAVHRNLPPEVNL
ncbi:hypothetical protein MSAS_40920 [Mycobacterium saskatchewanense]|nr:hypothetical protein MSAS_40920 [Mycobacterium saskatchewanense]